MVRPTTGLKFESLTQTATTSTADLERCKPVVTVMASRWVIPYHEVVTVMAARFRWAYKDGRWFHEVAPTSRDPLDVEYDEIPLRYLLAADEDRRREHPAAAVPRRATPTQRAAISAHWSAELRKKTVAAAAREPSVLVQLDEL